VTAEHDSKHIIRQWNREIEADDKRLANQGDKGPWRRVVWAALWFLWLLMLGALISVIRLHS
jgi:hypothetical protein